MITAEHKLEKIRNILQDLIREIIQLDVVNRQSSKNIIVFAQETVGRLNTYLECKEEMEYFENNHSINALTAAINKAMIDEENEDKEPPPPEPPPKRVIPEDFFPSPTRKELRRKKLLQPPPEKKR